MSCQQSEADMQTTHIKEFLANTRLKKTEVAEALKVTPQHLNDTIRKEIDVYIVHEGDKIIDSFLKRKWGKL